MNNKILILSDIIKGRGKFSAEWFLVLLKEKGSKFKWSLRPINEVINLYDGDIIVSKRGSLHLGKVTIQRKGGDNGRDAAI